MSTNDAGGSVPPQKQETKEFGERVRDARERVGLTLRQLSAKSKVSMAMLSKVERGEKSPTIGVAKQIALALDASLSYLTSGQEERRTVAVVRFNERHVFRDPNTGFERHVCAPCFPGSLTEVLYSRLPAHQSTGELPPYPTGTEEYIVIDQGQLVVAITGVDEYTLGPGDTLYFEADVTHTFSNRTAQLCAYFLFCSRCV